jgi:hypothetical protein
MTTTMAMNHYLLANIPTNIEISEEFGGVEGIGVGLESEFISI